MREWIGADDLRPVRSAAASSNDAWPRWAVNRPVPIDRHEARRRMSEKKAERAHRRLEGGWTWQAHTTHAIDRPRDVQGPASKSRPRNCCSRRRSVARSRGSDRDLWPGTGCSSDDGRTGSSVELFDSLAPTPRAEMGRRSTRHAQRRIAPVSLDGAGDPRESLRVPDPRKLPLTFVGYIQSASPARISERGRPRSHDRRVDGDVGFSARGPRGDRTERRAIESLIRVESCLEPERRVIGASPVTRHSAGRAATTCRKADSPGAAALLLVPARGEARGRARASWPWATFRGCKRRVRSRRRQDSTRCRLLAQELGGSPLRTRRGTRPSVRVPTASSQLGRPPVPWRPCRHASRSPSRERGAGHRPWWFARGVLQHFQLMATQCVLLTLGQQSEERLAQSLSPW